MLFHILFTSPSDVMDSFCNVHLREKKGNFYAAFYHPDRHPTRRWVTLRTKSKGVARQRLVDFERRVARGDYDPWEDPAPRSGIIVLKAIENFLDARRDRGLRDKTIENYRYTLKSFERCLPAALRIDHVDADHIRSFLGRDGLGKVSRDTYYRQLRTFLSWCKEEGLIKNDPITNVTRPGKPKKEAAYLTQKNLERLLKTIRNDMASKGNFVQEGEVTWLIDIIEFALYTGMRRGEICDLRWGAVDLDAGFITVRGTDEFETKSGHEARIPIVSGARNVLQKWRVKRESIDPHEHVFKGVRGGPLNGNYVSERFRRYRRMAGLPEDISFHNLRHSCASWLVMQDVPMRAVQAMLRHSTLDVTERYAHLADDFLRNPVEAAFANI